MQKSLMHSCVAVGCSKKRRVAKSGPAWVRRGCLSCAVRGNPVRRQGDARRCSRAHSTAAGSTKCKSSGRGRGLGCSMGCGGRYRWTWFRGRTQRLVGLVPLQRLLARWQREATASA